MLATVIRRAHRCRVALPEPVSQVWDNVQWAHIKLGADTLRAFNTSSSLLVRRRPTDTDYVMERKEYKKEMHELRKSFKEEVGNVYSAKAEAKAAKLEAERVTIQAEKAAWRAQRGINSAHNIARHNAFVAEKAKEREERRALMYIKLKEMEGWRTKQRQCVEDASLTWVEEHDLEKRIELALDNPRSLI